MAINRVDTFGDVYDVKIAYLETQRDKYKSEVDKYRAALELTSDKLSALESKYAKDGLQKFAAEFSRIKSKITQALEKEEK